MSTVPARPRRRFFSRRDPLWFKVVFVLVVIPIVSIVAAPVGVPVAVFRYIRRFVRRCRYVEFDGTQEQFECAAIRHIPLTCRWFRRSISVDDLDAALSRLPRWLELRAKIQPGDKIWPFTINPNTLAMRQGFIVVRRGKPVGHVVTVVS